MGVYVGQVWDRRGLGQVQMSESILAASRGLGQGNEVNLEVRGATWEGQGQSYWRYWEATWGGRGQLFWERPERPKCRRIQRNLGDFGDSSGHSLGTQK